MGDHVEHRPLTACCACGQTSPKGDGPRGMPAASWPTAAGWPKRWAASPGKPEASRMTTTAAMKVASEVIEVRRFVRRPSNSQTHPDESPELTV